MEYKIPFREANVEFVEKKSRFISHVTPVSSEEEALVFLRSIREKHREATHNVYAYRLKTMVSAATVTMGNHPVRRVFRFWMCLSNRIFMTFVVLPRVITAAS
jgi:hypothetical protein